MLDPVWLIAGSLLPLYGVLHACLLVLKDIREELRRLNVR